MSIFFLLMSHKRLEESLLTYNQMSFCHETVNLTVIFYFIGVKMTMNCDYDSVVGIILPIVHLILKLTITHPLCFTHFAKNVFLIVVKMAAPLIMVYGRFQAIWCWGIVTTTDPLKQVQPPSPPNKTDYLRIQSFMRYTHRFK